MTLPGRNGYPQTRPSTPVIEKPEKQSAAVSLGVSFGGGSVFWLDPSGRHGLVAAPSDLGSGTEAWSNVIPLVTGATADSVGGGLQNSLLIRQKMGTNSAGAANKCLELIIQDGKAKYDDWYLPSRHELNLLFLQRTIVGGFNQVNGIYWSSTESETDPGSMAWEQEFKFGAQYEDDKDMPNQVRCIRKF